MTEITFGPAQVGTKKIIAGLSGGTGSGKTFSALELGTGLVSDPATKLFVIDTEFGRAAHYANQFAFQYGELGPPFRPDRYMNAINAAIAYGAECVIVDSLSHMWEGEGGLLDWHGDIALKMAGGNESRTESYNFPAWRIPKQELQKFVLYLQRAPVHLILCLRAKTKSKMVKAVGQDGRPRTDIVDAGLQPIIDTATPYEATFLAMLSQEEPGVPHWTHKALAAYIQQVFQDGPKRLSREHGKRLAQWCGSARVDAMAEPTEVVEPVKTAKQRAQEIAQEFDGAPDIDALLKLEERLREDIARLPDIAKSRIAAIFHAKREELQKSEDSSFHNVVDALEPEDWKKDEGRVEDPRQSELME